MRRSVVVALAALSWVAAPLPARGDASVTMQRSRFIPREVTISVGESVTWTNEDGVGHSVTADDGSFDSHPNCGSPIGGECMGRGDDFTHTFTRAGRFAYYCRTHGSPGQGMTGSVTVRG